MRRKWTEGEDKQLKLLFPIASWVRIRLALPDKTDAAIKNRARKLKLIRKSSLSKRILFLYCNKHGHIHRTEVRIIRRKKGTVALCPRPYCNNKLRLEPRNSSQKRRYKEIVEELTDEEKESLNMV